MKPVCKRYKTLIDGINRLERGLYTTVNVGWCCDTIAWLWKWRKITESEMESLCDRMIAIMGHGN